MVKILGVMRIIRTYSELATLPTFEERFQYLQLNGEVGLETFGFDRAFNQRFYTSIEWRKVRDLVIVRDCGCDLGIIGREIQKGTKVFIHHMNPISLLDIERKSEILMNPEYLITTTHTTHNAIHYGDEELLLKEPIERYKNDTCPWRQE